MNIIKNLFIIIAIIAGFIYAPIATIIIVAVWGLWPSSKKEPTQGAGIAVFFYNLFK